MFLRFQYYESPIGKMFLLSDGIALKGVCFMGQKNFPFLKDTDLLEENDKILNMTKSWLDVYFGGREPDFMPQMSITGSMFQKSVWRLLAQIPYGQTSTYGEISSIIARQHGIGRMSAQAVGNAVSMNRFLILIPCHRVIGADGSLTGYAAGIEKKEVLLKLEKPH